MLSVTLILAYILSFVGFVDLVNFVFKVFGYIGLFITLSLLVRWFMNKFTKKITLKELLLVKEEFLVLPGNKRLMMSEIFSKRKDKSINTKNKI